MKSQSVNYIEQITAIEANILENKNDLLDIFEKAQKDLDKKLEKLGKQHATAKAKLDKVKDRVKQASESYKVKKTKAIAERLAKGKEALIKEKASFTLIKDEFAALKATKKDLSTKSARFMAHEKASIKIDKELLMKAKRKKR